MSTEGKLLRRAWHDSDQGESLKEFAKRRAAKGDVNAMVWLRYKREQRR